MGLTLAEKLIARAASHIRSSLDAAANNIRKSSRGTQRSL